MFMPLRRFFMALVLTNSVCLLLDLVHLLIRWVWAWGIHASVSVLQEREDASVRGCEFVASALCFPPPVSIFGFRQWTDFQNDAPAMYLFFYSLV